MAAEGEKDVSSIVWKAVQEDRREGYRRGYEEGRKEAVQEEEQRIAKFLLEAGYSVRLIAYACESRVEDILKLKASLRQSDA